METVFDVSRAFIREQPAVPPLYNPPLIPIQEAASRFTLDSRTPLLRATVAGRTLVINTVHLVYFHVVQGVVENTPWLASFCLICNAGACFSPVIDGQVHHFSERGLYNAMTLLGDAESGSIWDHYSGRCYHGPLQGRRLETLSALQHTTLAQAISLVPEALFVVSALEGEAQATAESWDDFRRSPTPELTPRTAATLDKEDDRLPRFEAGLGVWDGQDTCFYTYKALNAADNVLFDTINGQGIIVFIDPLTQNPQAYFTEAKSATWRGDTLVLDNKDYICDSLFFKPNGQRVQPRQPEQLFQRWYSFALRFPNPRIHGA